MTETEIENSFRDRISHNTEKIHIRRYIKGGQALIEILGRTDVDIDWSPKEAHIHYGVGNYINHRFVSISDMASEYGISKDIVASILLDNFLHPILIAIEDGTSGWEIKDET